MFSKNFVSFHKEFCTIDRHVNAPILRKTFFLDKLPDKCCIRVCGLGFYRIFINGKEITRSFLAPYISNVDDVLYYNDYELKEFVKTGKNAICFLLGNGFLNNLGGYNWFFDKASFRSSPKVAFALQIDDKIIEADLSVKAIDSAITFDDLRCGERYDARLEIDGCFDADFDDSSWNNVVVAETPKGEPRICRADDIVTEKFIKPVKISKVDGGYIYDFGINTAGVINLRIDGFSGQKIKLVFGEIVADGKIDLSNISFANTLEDYNQCIIYVCKKGNNFYRPSFCYMGFRYVFVSGITDEQVNKDLLVMEVLHSDLKDVCDFKCSSEVVNKLYLNVRNSTLSNFMFIPTDCPQREKNGWTGDVALSCEQMMLNYKAENSLREWLYNVRKTQLENGKIACITPTTGWGYEWGPGPGWDLVLVEVPYRIYQFTHDKSVIEENSQAIYKYIKYMLTQVNEKGLLTYGLGDWCQVNLDSVLNYTTPLFVTDTLICMNMCEKAQKLFEIIGDVEKALQCAQIKEKLRNAFRRECLDDELFVSGRTQTGQATAIFYGAFNKEEKEIALQNLIKLIHQNGDKFDVGVLGGRVLFRVLADNGYVDLAYKLIVQPEFPSFGYQINLGATSLWESFYELDENFKPKDGRKIDILSQNHHFWGDVSAFIVEYLAGIRINEELADSDTVEIKPCFIKELKFVSAKREFSEGELVVEWVAKDKLYVKIICPKKVEAVFSANEEKYKLHEGENLFSFIY